MSSRQLRALIALVAAIGVGIAIGMAASSIIIGVGIVVLGVIAIAFVLKRTADDDGSEREPRSRKARGDDDDDPGFEDLTSSGQPLTSRTRPAEAPEPLQTWTPPEPLQTWTPATNRSIEPTKAPPETETPWGTSESSDTDLDFASTPAAWDEPAVDPLDELDRLDDDGVGSLDDVDVVAEVERIDHASNINEEVESSDDIMAASEATQLTIGAGDNTELAKLLAKVQERLTAYE